MKNILLVFTGGTIGSAASEGTINTTGTARFELIRQFRQHHKNDHYIEFNTIQPLQILSENLAPRAWQILIAAIEAERPDQFDGIIITHGTDTLAYTAAALSYYFHTTKVPILLVGSDYPLDDPKANGLENFTCAVEFIVQKKQAGVFVPYRNPQQAMQVHKGSRLTCSLQLSGDFFSVQSRSYMLFENSRFTLNHPSKSNLFMREGPNDNIETDILPLKASFSDRVLMIKPYPGLDYRHFNLENVDAILHDLYHSGTACASTQWGDHYSLSEFIKRCGEQGVKVYLAPAVKSPDVYQSARLLIEQGAVMIWNMAIEAAYVKLILAYGNFNDEQQIINFINRDITGEHV
ncbi:MAG: asparaginase domain-containing protein [Methylococcales bacterium]|nr:asparaginase domain-containing protein [Methylococcales bacterium]